MGWKGQAVVVEVECEFDAVQHDGSRCRGIGGFDPNGIEWGAVTKLHRMREVHRQGPKY